ncbi:MAG: hypothetical protein WCS99_04955 [Limisphaerales bacterium]
MSETELNSPADPRAKNNWLMKHARNEASKAGEDGVLEKIFSILGVENGWAVEFGAWDGKHLSNTWNLVVNHGWSGVYIEADTARFQDLLARFRDTPRVHSFNEYVQFTGPGSLDSILARTPIPEDFALLSIDVDGNDYHFWDSVVRYRPRVVIIEFNPAIPDTIEFVQPRDMSLNQGNSLAALAKLGKSKGYELICITDKNAIFVAAKDYARFNIPDNSPAAMRDDSKYRLTLFQLYDGTLVLDGCNRLVWHKLPLGRFQLQVLPKLLRHYPGIRPSFWKRQLYKFYTRRLRRQRAGD